MFDKSENNVSLDVHYDLTINFKPSKSNWNYIEKYIFMIIFNDILNLNVQHCFGLTKNLTVKPRVIRTRRLGRDKGPASKLCVTLESKSPVDSVISSSQVLRASPDPELRKVFFNRDLTRMQAEQAYLRRVERRSASRNQPTAPTRPFQ